MNLRAFLSLLCLGWAALLSSQLTYADLNSSHPVNGSLCHAYLNSNSDELTPVLNLIRHPDTLPRNAIKSIVGYLKNQYFWNGERKHKEWQELVHIYNQGRNTYWINAPYLKTDDGDIVCWGETRGHLLIFRRDGKIFTSFNPQRPNPSHGVNRYKIDWDDPTLN